MEPTPPAAYSAPPPASSVPDGPRSRDRVRGLVIVAGAFAVCLAVSIWAKEKSRPEVSEPPGPPTAQGIKDFPQAVDPLQALQVARTLSKRPILRGIVMDGVELHGLVTLSDAAARVRYSFQSPAGQGAQPPRDPGTLPKRVTCGKQNVILRQEGMVAEPDLADYPCAGGLEPLPEPECSPRELWKIARKRKVPKEALAHIEYFRAKAGPAWRFEISGTPQRFTMYGDCKRELIGADAHGNVP